MSDLNGRYRLAFDRVEELRAEAARERLAREAVRERKARSVARPGVRERTSVRAALGLLFIRVGRALGGEGKGIEVATRAPARSFEEAGS